MFVSDHLKTGGIAIVAMPDIESCKIKMSYLLDHLLFSAKYEVDDGVATLDNGAKLIVSSVPIHTKGALYWTFCKNGTDTNWGVEWQNRLS